jgi:hypothetical protein
VAVSIGAAYNRRRERPNDRWTSECAQFPGAPCDMAGLCGRGRPLRVHVCGRRRHRLDVATTPDALWAGDGVPARLDLHNVRSGWGDGMRSRAASRPSIGHSSCRGAARLLPAVGSAIAAGRAYDRSWRIADISPDRPRGAATPPREPIPSSASARRVGFGAVDAEHEGVRHLS